MFVETVYFSHQEWRILIYYRHCTMLFYFLTLNVHLHFAQDTGVYLLIIYCILT